VIEDGVIQDDQDGVMQDGVTQLSLIAAFDRDFAIGKDNALPWHLPADLKRFKALTMGKPLLMGRRTAESLGRALPGRRNLVLTRSGRVPFDGMQAIASLDEALRLAAEDQAGELCVIGGGEIFAMTLPLAARMHLTRVDTVVDGADAFFPRFDPARWRVAMRELHAADAKHAFAFEFVDYECVDCRRT
jgi:dihydrofolate reductase